jgi:hypothetical protein
MKPTDPSVSPRTQPASLSRLRPFLAVSLGIALVGLLLEFCPLRERSANPAPVASVRHTMHLAQYLRTGQLRADVRTLVAIARYVLEPDAIPVSGSISNRSGAPTAPTNNLGARAPA